MNKIYMRGGKKLIGSIKISGAKNAALPLIAASILSDKELVLSNIPNLEDIKTMIQLTKELGVEFKKCSFFGGLKNHDFIDAHLKQKKTKKVKNAICFYV